MLLDEAVFLPEYCYIHYAPVGSTAPTDAMVDDYDLDDPDTLGAGMTAWNHLGHTDLDEDIEGDEEGGKTEVRGTRQKPNMRTRDEPVTDFFTVTSVQVSAGALKLYFGGGTEVAGKFIVPRTKRSAEKAILLIFIDGDRRFGIYHPRCSVKRGGAKSMEAENFFRFPIRCTPLDPGAAAESDTIFLSSDLFNGTDGDA